MRTVDMKRIMMVDDDYAAHTFHKIMMEQAGFIDNEIQIDECYSVEEALKKLLPKSREDQDLPEIILIDINMPRKTGWDFLEAFQKIEFEGMKPYIYMVTNSENPSDIRKVSGYKDVVAFKTKFLDQAFFKQLLEGGLPN